MTEAGGVVILLGRILFAYFFGAVSGVAHLRNDPMYREYAQQAGFPVPAVAGWVAGAWLIAGALSVSLGVWPDVGALMIGAFAIPAALFFHRFWAIEDETQKMFQAQLFYRNLIIIGASVVFFGAFASLGSELRFALTEPLFDL